MKKKAYQSPLNTDFSLETRESLLLATSLTPDVKDNTDIEVGGEDEEWDGEFLSDKKGFAGEDFWNE